MDWGEMKIVKILLAVNILLLLCLWLFGVREISRMESFSMQLQRVSSLPSGDLCIAVLGEPMYKYEGGDFGYAMGEGRLTDQMSYFKDKIIYAWGRRESKFIIAVIDKNTDKVCFVTWTYM